MIRGANMIFAAILTGLVLLLPVRGAAAASACLDYSSPLSLEGTLVQRTFPGPPNFLSIAQGDRPLIGWLLHLAAPVCVAQDVRAGYPFNQAVVAIQEFQLVLSGGVDETKLLGKRVRVTGTLFGRDNAFHKTPVLIQTQRLDAAAPAPPGEAAKAATSPAASKIQPPVVVQSWDLHCDMGFTQRSAVSMRLQVAPESVASFQDTNGIADWADARQAEALKYCQQDIVGKHQWFFNFAQPKIGDAYEIEVVSLILQNDVEAARLRTQMSNKPCAPCGSIVLRLLKKPGGKWIVLESNAGQLLAQQKLEAEQKRATEEQAAAAARAAEEQRRAQTEALANLRGSFVKTYSVEKFASARELFANPFTMKDEVVAVRVVFRRMLSETEAVFSSGDVELLVESVPAARFRGEEDVMLALKVRGTKPIKTAGGEVTLPYGDYVGVRGCAGGCQEFQ